MNINKDEDPLKLWMMLINAETEEDLVRLEQTNVKEIKEACQRIREMSADKHAMEVSRRREKQLRDEAEALSFARDEDRQKE